MEDKCIEVRIKKYTKYITKKIKNLEVDLQKKADTEEMENLQERLEDIDKKIRKLMEENSFDKSWVNTTGSKTIVEEEIQKSLKAKDTEERER